MSDAPPHLSPDDLAWLQAIWRMQERANALYDFAQAYLTEKYGLAVGDTVQGDGTIQRAPSA